MGLIILNKNMISAIQKGTENPKCQYITDIMSIIMRTEEVK